MRFYDIEISGGVQGVGPTFSFKSLDSSGNFNPGALNVEFDINEYDYAGPVGASHVRIWGVPINSTAGVPGINQASNLNGSTITVSAGMSKGLPLANPQQQGQISSGQIFQAFGNWIGTNMTLDVIFYAGPSGVVGTQSEPANITLNWLKGTPMSQAITNTLQTAYPGYTVNVDISPKLVLTEDEKDIRDTLQQFSQFLNDVSRSINTDDSYTGVHLVLNGMTFNVYDGLGSSKPIAKQIAFTDLIGQPTWIGFNQVQSTVVMRGDLSVGDSITFPKTQTTTTAAEASQQAADKSAFQGTFTVASLRHVGNFRAADAGSWVTVIEAYGPPTSDEAAAFQPTTEG